MLADHDHDVIRWQRRKELRHGDRPAMKQPGFGVQVFKPETARAMTVANENIFNAGVT
jgi:hypothetical protein